MYPSSTSSSSHGSMGPTSGTSSNNGGGGGGLMRYGSAPSAFLSTAVESVTGQPSREFSSLESRHHHHQQHRQYQPHNFTVGQPTRFFPMENSSQSNCNPSNNNSNSNTSSTTTSSHNQNQNQNHNHNHSSSGEQQHRNGQNINTTIGLQRSSYRGLKQDTAINGGGSEMVSSTTTSTSPLIRHSSLPAGFLNHLAHAASSTDENGFSITRGHAISRLNSQLSFTRQETLSHISEENENVVNGLNNRDCDQKKASHSYATTSYGVGSWEDGNSLMFSVGTSKRDKNIGHDIVNGLSSMETQFQFSMPHTVIEMSTMDNLLNIPQDSVPCKIRAKRGCATHPRSIAERERRTRISGKLKKLQDLVPNMDKQTSYADMLDLAVQHIKGLQNQVQKLNKELEQCKCGCKKPRNAGGEEQS